MNEKWRCNMDKRDVQTIKEVTEIINKIKKLQRQIDNPDRQGMIAALSDAQSTACRNSHSGICSG